MSFILQAPVPALQTTTQLPSPQFNDSEGRRLVVDVKRSMNNTKRSYVKSSARSRVTYTFLLSRMKALELRAFIQSYYAAKLRWIDNLGDVWQGYLTGNPVEFSAAGRAQGWPGGEYVEVTIQLEGTRISNGPRNQC